jgi:hypothetical protein
MKSLLLRTGVLLGIMFLLSLAAQAQSGRTAQATASILNGFVVSITVTDGGSGYSSPPSVVLVNGGGTGASAVATIDSTGAVTGINLLTAGSGYTSAPAVVISSPSNPAPQQAGSLYFGGDSYVSFIVPFFGGQTLTAFTMELWCRPTDLSNSQVLWTKYGYGIEAAIILNPDASFTFHYTFDHSYHDTASPAGAVGQGKWNHLAITMANGVVTLYVNGVQLASHAQTAPLNWDQNTGGSSLGQNELGRDNNGVAGPNQYYTGLITEFRIWNRPLSQQEIQQKMLLSLNVSAETGLVDYWRCNDGQGNTLFDSAGADDGTIQGAKWSTDSPLTIQPHVTIETQSVRVNMFVNAGRTYRLESSSDLVNWTAIGSPFVATGGVLSEVFDVSQTGRYFRLSQLP